MKKGFTLAEVLVTLGILGVVAAITLPTLINKYQEKRTVTQLKKTYSALSQAYQRMEQEYGTIDTWLNGKIIDENGTTISDPNDPELFIERLSKYMKVVKICKGGENCVGKKAYDLSGKQTNDGTSWGDPSMVLADGTHIVASNYNSDIQYISIYVIFPGKDIVLGKNRFYFYGLPHRVIPEGNYQYHSLGAGFYTNCKPYAQDSNAPGRGCAAWIIINENMDYLHCQDKLRWEGPTSCK